MLPVTFLTDYGYSDEFAGACRLVIEALAPGTTVVDVTHGIPAGDVRRGALALEAAAPAGPVAVHLAVVDPGVGTERRAVALRAGRGDFLVGPDNGLLAPAAAALDGVVEAVDVSRSALRREPVAPTFHGRDLFAPVAAHLAAGRPLRAAGEPTDPQTLAPLALPEPTVTGDEARVHVLYADAFGNLTLAARARDVADVPALTEPGARLRVSAPAGEFAAVRGSTFADAVTDALVLHEDSTGRLALAVNLGSAAELLGARRDDELALAPA